MPNSQSLTTKASRAKNAARWVKGQQAQGAYRLSVLLPPTSAAQLEALADIHGSKRAAIIAVLDAAVDNSVDHIEGALAAEALHEALHRICPQLIRPEQGRGSRRNPMTLGASRLNPSNSTNTSSPISKTDP